MLSLLVMTAASAASVQTPALKAVGGLAGCWSAPGKVRGKDAASVARGTWRLGGRYFLLQLRALSARRPYEAAIIYGAGDKPDALSSYWLDTFGGAYATSGAGAATSDGFSVDYRYPDSRYINRFARSGTGWRWTIVEQAGGKPEKLFAEYQLAPASCRGMSFDF